MTDDRGGGVAMNDPSEQPLNILALEPYYGGSHRAFLDGWRAHSRHRWTVLSLPPHKWKWRMRHAAVTLADQVAARLREGQRWNAIFCSDMLNLAEFLGLAPQPLRSLPSIVYFHENQLTYPVRWESERDYQFVMTNLTTALAASSVWFNSAFHRDSFLPALTGFLKLMPDHQPLVAVDRIAVKSRVEHPGIDSPADRPPRPPGPLRILWAARWEHDKNPETFFEALDFLQRENVAFRLSVIGERFRESPEIFDRAEKQFAPCIDRWGYQPTRDDYLAALGEADVIVSTALHEFFGIAVIEATAAGAYPLLPDRLAYPEVLSRDELPNADAFFYDGSAEQLARKLIELARRIETGGTIWPADPLPLRRAVGRYLWPNRAPCLDRALERVMLP